MTAKELKEEYIDFFEKRGHKKLPNVSLVPDDDPTTLFISAGMQPLVPYLLGEPHPLGKRLVSLQRCLRTGDISEVGNVSHHTFFEMLGNWSLGDPEKPDGIGAGYWKKESLAWSYEFLTKVLGLNPKRLHVTIFKGDKNAPRDKESEKTWLSLGIPKERIYPLPKEDNWWEAGETGPGGPDSEIFYDIGKPACSSGCRPGDGCGRFFEMWNNVFMEYNRKTDGSYEKLKQKNVDTGMGVERTTVVLEKKNDVYQTSLFAPIIKQIEEMSGRKYEGDGKKLMRIIADHLRAAVFVIADGITPSNKDRGYILRRLIRRAVFKMVQLPISGSRVEASENICQEIIDRYSDIYPNLEKSLDIGIILGEEVDKFERTLNKGVKFLWKYTKLDGKIAFDVLQTYGIPFDVTQEIAFQRGQKIKKEEFEKEFKKHQKLSRKGAGKKFAGGLANQGAETTKLHTATHLLHAALRQVLGKHVQQKGSNITPERLRFDFTHPEKLTKEELKKTEDLINQRVKENLPVKMEVVSLEEAKKQGALAFFVQKYGDRVKVYSIGSYSKEVCGGPHVAFTKEIGRVKITKSEKIGSGVQRVYAVLAD